MRGVLVRSVQLVDRAVSAASTPAGVVWLALNGPAWIYGLRDGKAGGDASPASRGVISDILDMAKAGWDEAKLPIVVFLMLGIALAAQKHKRGHDDAKDEIKGKAIAIVLAIFAFPIAY
jgi:hypothetical protein